MNRDEINRKISKLRDEWNYVYGTREFDGFRYEQAKLPKDWHGDANWPTLLREMPAFNMLDARRICDAYQCNAEMFVTEPVLAPTIEEAVCLAWLKWKEGSGEEDDPKKTASPEWHKRY